MSFSSLRVIDLIGQSEKMNERSLEEGHARKWSTY